MNIQQEEILLKEFTSGTTLLFFSTHLTSDSNTLSRDPDIIYTPTILWLDNFNTPVKVSTFDGKNIWTLNSENNYVPIEELSNNHMTGYSYVRDYSHIINDNRLNQIRERFTQQIEESLNTGATITTSEGVIPNPNPPIVPTHIDYVFRQFNEIDDFFVNIKLNRTFGTLDTLNIYNNLVNSMPTQEADTGVVFGRLMARQKIKDEEGNNISIPLRNVPIGIFNSSEDYPSSTSTDSGGNRIYLNNKENSNPSEYFNIQSFSADTNSYLRSVSQFTSVPDQYKYITTTNENGEFIIYDVPVGNRIVIFEVDLFKQGLTKDEIALNFFPFPIDDESNIDTIPSFSFKQFPIDVVKSWGTIQTGYTELDIVVNYDLRKWATFYVPPMGYDNKKLGSQELANFSPTLNVEIRDMSKEDFPIRKLPVVEIQDIYDKEEEQTLLWDAEFAQLKNTAKFFEQGFRAFKVPANMYDPKGYRTDNDGIPRSEPTSQGVWLAGYQFKLYYNQKNSIFRTTGFQRDWGYTNQPGGWIGRDHFHLNRGETSDAPNTSVVNQTYSPYDKPWTALYPDKYKIPAKPIDKNYIRSTMVGRLPATNPRYLEQPEYKDGDLNGLQVTLSSITTADVGGYGIQRSISNNFWFPNRFSKEVTSGFIYKYEAGVARNETYSNGYEPSNGSFPIQPGISRVLNGERYQRVECGYGYWLRPEGWPPVSAEPWGDTIFSQATRNGAGLTGPDFKPGVLAVGQSNGNNIVQVQNIPIDVYNFEDKDIALALDNNATYSEGALSLYRIIDPNKRIERGPEIISTSATFNFQDFYFQRGPNSSKIITAHDTDNNNTDDRYFSKLVGGSPHAQFGYNLLEFEITNLGNITVSIPGTNINLSPGGSAIFTTSQLPLQGASITLAGNSNFDFATSKYTRANYRMKFKNILCRKNNGDPLGGSGTNVPQERIIANTNVTAQATPPNYYLITRYGNVRTQYDKNNDSCKTSGTLETSLDRWVNKVKMNGALFNVPNTSGGGYIIDMRFWDAPVGPPNQTCAGGNSHGGNAFSIAIEVFE